MQDNEYTDAQVGDARGLFKSLDPVPCGAVPAHLIQCSSFSLPDPMLRFQSTSSSALVPCSLPYPVLQFQSTSSIALVPYIQSASSSLPHPVLIGLLIQVTSSSLVWGSSSLPNSVPIYLIQNSGSMHSASVRKTLISVLYMSYFTFFE